LLDTDLRCQEKGNLRAVLKFSSKLVEKQQVIVLNKMDMPETDEPAAVFRESVENKSIYEISAITGSGVDALVSALNHIINKPDIDDNE